MNDIQRIHSQYGGNVSLYFKDLNTGDIVSYNNQSMYSCSIIKIFVMVTLYHYAELGEVDLNSYRSYLNSMMINSDNSSYNYLLSILGNGDGLQGAYKVNEYLQSLGIYNTYLHHGLLPGDGFFTDGGTNVSTPEDIGLVLEKIYMCQIAEKPFCEDMIYLMTECADHSALSQGIVCKSINKFLNRFTTFFISKDFGSVREYKKGCNELEWFPINRNIL